MVNSIIKEHISDEPAFFRNVSKVIHAFVNSKGGENNNTDLNIEFNNIEFGKKKLNKLKKYLNEIAVISNYSRIGDKSIILNIKKDSPFIASVKKLYEIL